MPGTLPETTLPETVLSITLDSTFESVDAGVEAVERFTQAAGIQEPDRYFICLAAREILVNAILHGNRCERDKKVELRLSGDDANMTIEVTDQGNGFRLEDVPDPRLAEYRERTSGRGIRMAQAFMDEFSVDRIAEGGAHIRMVKHLPGRSKEPSPSPA